jgi:hypothetical protein
MRISIAVIVGGLVAIAALATAAVLFVSGDQSLERLAVLVAVFGSIVPGLVASLKADQASTQTNGNLDERIERAVGKVVGSRRTGDRVVLHETRHTDPVDLAPPPPADQPAGDTVTT